MLEDTNKERELFLENKKLEDIKINRVLEKNFFEEVNTALNYLYDFSTLLEKDEIENNYILQYSLINNLSNSIQNEIEDNLILLTKEKSEIYLKKLYDITNVTLDRINQELSHFENGQLEEVFDISYNLVKDNEYVLYACESFSKVKKKRLERLIEVIDINLKYYKSSEFQNTYQNSKNNTVRAEKVYSNTIFTSIEAQQWFQNTLGELNALDVNNKARSGFQAKANAIFSDSTCKKVIFKYGVLLKDFIVFLNKEYKAGIKAKDKLSDGLNHSTAVENLIQLYKES